MSDPESAKIHEMLSRQQFHRLTDIKFTHLKSVDSTQTYMSQQLKGDREGETVVAEVQTSGKGREGRSWASDKGGLWMTIVLRPPTAKILEKVVLIASRSVVRTLEEFGLMGLSIKPPNDVCCDGKKIAGILADSIVQGDNAIVYLGIGINVNNDITLEPSISNIATSVSQELGRYADLAKFTVSSLKNLDEEYNGEIESYVSTT